MLNASIKNLAISLLTDLLKTYSPTYHEEKAIKVLYDYAIKSGFDEVIIDGVGNLKAKIGNGKRKILLASHIDTVSGFIPVNFDGLKFVGRGAVDAKGPLASMFIASLLAKNHVDLTKFSIYVMALVGEEGSSHGAWHIVNSGQKYDYIIVGEPSNNTNVIIGYRGSCKIKIKCKSVGGHSSSPWLYNSACEKIIKLWHSLSKFLGGEGVNDFSVAIVKFECGAESTVIPKYGEAIIDCRIPIGKNINDVHTVIKSLPKINGCEVEIINYISPVKVSLNNIVVRALFRALIKLSQKPKPVIKLGTSDMNILFNNVTTNIAAYGPGRSELSHSEYEELKLYEYMLGIKTYTNAIIELVNLIK